MNIDRILFNSVSSARNRLTILRNLLRVRMFKREFDYRSDDIYVATYMKSGTTLLQMILYQLFTDGNMDFDHIYDVSPWLEHAIAHNISLKDFASCKKLTELYLRKNLVADLLEVKYLTMCP